MVVCRYIDVLQRGRESLLRCPPVKNVHPYAVVEGLSHGHELDICHVFASRVKTIGMFQSWDAELHNSQAP